MAKVTRHPEGYYKGKSKPVGRVPKQWYTDNGQPVPQSKGKSVENNYDLGLDHPAIGKLFAFFFNNFKGKMADKAKYLGLTPDEMPKIIKKASNAEYITVEWDKVAEAGYIK